MQVEVYLTHAGYIGQFLLQGFGQRAYLLQVGPGQIELQFFRTLAADDRHRCREGAHAGNLVKLIAQLLDQILLADTALAPVLETDIDIALVDLPLLADADDAEIASDSGRMPAYGFFHELQTAVGIV